MNKFEVVLLYSPELATNNIETELSNFKSKITSSDGKVINMEDWGLRDLSYTINKFKKAFYKYLQIEMSGEKIPQIKNDLNQSDNLLRYIFIKVKNHQELPTKLINEKK